MCVSDEVVDSVERPEEEGEDGVVDSIDPPKEGEQ